MQKFKNLLLIDLNINYARYFFLNFDNEQTEINDCIVDAR